MRPPRFDGEPTVERVPDGWVYSYDLTIPDREWLLAFWAASQRGPVFVRTQEPESVARQAFDEIRDHAEELWREIGSNGP